MALTNQQRLDVMRRVCRAMFDEARAVANLDTIEVKAAIDALDSIFDAQASTLTQNQTVQANFVNALPEPFKSNTTAAQKTLVFTYVAMKRGGLL